MSKKISICFLFLLPLLAQDSLETVWARDDFQVWTELKAAHSIKKAKIELQGAGDSQWSRNAGDYFVRSTAIGGTYKGFQWFSTGLFYRFEQTKNVTSGAFDGEHRLSPQLELSATAGPLQLKNRHIGEVRFFPKSDEVHFRYRNSIRVQHKFSAAEVSLTPYVAEEFFIDKRRVHLNQFRLVVGNVFGFLKDRLNFDLYYLLRADKIASGLWRHTHVLGLGLGAKF